MKTLRISWIVIAILCLSIISCQNNEQVHDSFSKTNGYSSNNEKMAGLLEEAHSKIDLMKVSYHLNAQRAETFKKKITESQNFNDQIVNRVSYAYETLLAGDSGKAILELEQLLHEFRLSNVVDKPFEHQLLKFLAIAYLRLGEQENCIGKNNEESCIIPIQNKGIYKLTSGSETAISLFKELLSEDPLDFESVWLLNVAYMTIGQYPDAVPKKWLIPEDSFEPKGNISPFKNITNKLQLDVVALAGGSCVEDFNNDGYLDIMASSWDIREEIKLFLNNGNGVFSDKSKETKLKGITGGINMIHADYNNDGWEDVFVLRGGWYLSEGHIPNSLLKNNGDGTFTDVTIESGLLSMNPTQTATWADFNLDGWIDLFIGNESAKGMDVPCELFINNKGVFTNYTLEAGIGTIRGIVKGVTSGDVNNDGWPDIYVSIMGKSNLLLLNIGPREPNQVPKFREIGQQANVNMPLTSFPTWMWDFNNDGNLDIFAGSFDLINPKVAFEIAKYLLGKDNNVSKVHLYKNNGDLTFTEVSDQVGINEPTYVMGSNFGDIDNDGFLDFYLGTGAPNYSAIVPNKMYHNIAGEEFIDVTYSSRLGHIQKGHGVSFGDMDNDGDEDIFHVLGGAYEGDVFTNAFFENTLTSENNWITLKLEGVKSNKSAIGAKIKLVCLDEKSNSYTIYRNVTTGGSFGSSSLQQEIGIGKAIKIDSLEITWPYKGNKKDVFSNILPNQFIKIIEGDSKIYTLTKKKIKF